MIAKIGFVALVLISCGTLFLLDYYLKQDQEENTQQLHTFVQQTREIAKAKISAKEQFEMRLMTDIAHCQDNALKTYNAYILLLEQTIPIKHGAPNGVPKIPKEILDQATALLADEKAECKKNYDARLQEGF